MNTSPDRQGSGRATKQIDHELAVIGRFNFPGVLTAAGLREVPDGTRVPVAGVVTHRQRP